MNALTRLLYSNHVKGKIFNITRCIHNSVHSNIAPLLPHFADVHNPWIWKKNDEFKLPIHRISKIELPKSVGWIPITEPPVLDKCIEAPSNVDSDITKEAVRLIVIRRKKMKKHKLRKLRKRMKFEWAKKRQRRELIKEKAFQAVLIQQCKEAEAFSAEQYVSERIEKLNEIIIPRYWKGRRLPEFIIREKMGLPPKK